MSLINQNIKNLVSGISQQPPILRHPEQLEEQLNGYSTEAGGLQKRPPTMFISKLTQATNIDNKPLIHFIDRDESEKYMVVFTGEGVDVYDLEGNKKTVKYQDNCKSYVYTQKPRYNLKPITIADYTFVVNTQQVVRMSSIKSPNVWDSQGLLVNIKSGQYGRTYKININGTDVASFQTPDGSVKEHSKQIATDYIAEQLATQCISQGYIVEKGSSWLYVNKVSKVTTSGESATIRPSTTPKQQYDRFMGLRNQYKRWHSHEELRNRGLQRVSLNGVSIVIEGIMKAGWDDNSHFSGKGQPMMDEINRCRGDNWTIKEEDIVAVWGGMSSDTKRYTLTYTETAKPNTETIDKTEIKEATVYDGFNNQAAFGILTTVQKFTNLPISAPDGFVVKITGEEGDTSSDYYVRFDNKDKVWKECVRPGMKDSFDAHTMPHVLVREADGTFTFKAAEWTPRDIGDEDSNPLPSFIDNTINDIFYHRNRLGVLAGENVILTRSADFFNFWMTSATKVQDTDPIDLAASDSTISTLYNAVPYDEDLIVFSKEAQFALRADGVLTPKDAVLTSALTHYGASLSAKPVNAGRNIYFTAERALFTTVREFFTAMDNTEAKDVQDITSHVPNYIPNGVYKIIPSTIENIMFLLTEGEENAMYVYKYLFIDGQRVQAAWSKWDFQDRIYGGAFIDSYLYLVVERKGFLCLERMSFTFNTTDFPSEPYRVLLDSKVAYKIPAGKYDESTDTTTVSLSDVFGDLYTASVKDVKTYGAVTSDGVYHKNEGDSFVFIGDLTGQYLICGLDYVFRITLSQIMLKQASDGGSEAMTEGRLQLKQMWFNYADTGYFKIRVTTQDKGKYEYLFTGREVGTIHNHLDLLPFTTGKFTFPIQSENTKCTIVMETDMPLPIAIVGAGWIGNYFRRSRRV